MTFAAACLIITLHMGGRIDWALNEVDIPDCVRIEGTCASACTAYLGHDDVCVTPDAQLGFHGVYGGDWVSDAYWTYRLALEYPVDLRKWYLDSPSDLRGDDVAWLSGREVAAMGVPLCKFWNRQNE